MPTYFSQDEAEAFQAAEGRFGIFFRMAGTTTEPDLCLWSGLRDATFTMSRVLAQQFFVDEFGNFITDEYGRRLVTAEIGSPVVNTYRGLGVLIDCPDLDSMTDGTADDVAFSISMLSDAVLPYLGPEPPVVRGRRVNVGIVAFGSDWQPRTRIIPLAQYVASHLAPEIAPAQDVTEPQICTLTLVCSNGDTTRSRGAPFYWTSEQWKPLHDGSTFCDRTLEYQRGVRPNWPNFSGR